MMFQDQPATGPTICRHTMFLGFFLFFSDKEKQTMTPVSLFGSREGHTDCTSKQRDMVVRVL